MICNCSAEQRNRRTLLNRKRCRLIKQVAYVVWVAMLIGAIMIRKIPEGGFRREGLMRTVWRSSIAVGVAFVFTGAIAKRLGLEETEYLMLIGATVAGSSETFIEWIRNPSRFISLFRNGGPK